VQGRREGGSMLDGEGGEGADASARLQDDAAQTCQRDRPMRETGETTVRRPGRRLSGLPHPPGAGD